MVEPLAATAGTPDLFVYAIMRKESSFLPHALSPSDARGLLQLIPATGQESRQAPGRALVYRRAV